MTDPRGEQFSSLMERLAESSHGSAELRAVKGFLDDLKKTAAREAFLLPLLCQEALSWASVKDRVWPGSADTQDKNRFPFLQGDLIATTMVLSLGMAQSSQTHNLWLALAPDCDCVRAPYVRVAPVFPVYTGSRTISDRKQRFDYSLKLSSPKAFPLPRLADDTDHELRGYYADLEVPYYLTHPDKGLATARASLTVTGWHLLNAVIQEKETRALDMNEAVAVRGQGRPT